MAEKLLFRTGVGNEKSLYFCNLILTQISFRNLGFQINNLIL